MFENKRNLNRKGKRIRKLASEWLAERDEGWEGAREEEFEAWRSRDVRHDIALRELDASWNRLKELRHLIDDPSLRPNADILSAGGRLQRQRRRSLLAIGGSIAALIAVSLGLWLATVEMAPNELPEPVSYTTTFNDYQQITLKDGSVMEMNANTQVEVEFTKSRRGVNLLRGEAHFQVEKDASRPFFVEVGSVSVKAVGTAFNVRYGSSEVQVLVTEGRVAIDALRSEPEISGGETTPTMYPELIAGDQVTISTQSDHLVPLLSKVESKEYENILAWKGPRLFFNATPLEEAARQFNEQNVVQVIIEDDELRNLSIGGSFLVEDVEAFVRLLAGDGSIAVERSDFDRVLLKPAQQ